MKRFASLPAVLCFFIAASAAAQKPSPAAPATYPALPSETPAQLQEATYGWDLRQARSR